METSNAESQKRFLVNPSSLKASSAHFETGEASILDISFLRVVVEDTEATQLPEGKYRVEFFLDSIRFAADVISKSKGPGWRRFDFEKLLPSSHAHLRSFLCPKKVGESILQDVATETTSHYHGLNETELWSDSKGGILFTYLDPEEPQMQFLVRIVDETSGLRVGRIARTDYMSLDSLEGEIPLVPLTDRQMYSKLNECRDIITNFRPCGQGEYVIKQRLLKSVSDTLYSTGKRVEFTVPRPPKVVTLPAEN